jgi:hypothetical protein
MLRNAKELKNYSLRAEDGLIGTVREFYFDELHWSVRYLVVDTGSWLSRRLVLISPEALGMPEWDEQVLPVRLTQDQVKHSPDIDTAQPVSRQREAELRKHYGWPIYWGSIYAPPPVEPPPIPEKPPGDPHLRSTSEIIGDRLEASDGEIGHVADVLIEDDTWALRYFVIDTRNWWPGRHVVISPRWVTKISWEQSKISVAMTKALIKASPAYDPQRPLDPSYADKLHDYYGQPRPVNGEPTSKFQV